MEIWKDISEFDNKYQISNLGRVRRKLNGILKKNDYHYLNGSINNTGYYQVNLNHKKRLIHRLVGIYFINNPLNKPCINHINGNKLDNNFLNLEWVTHSENSIHADKIGLMNFKKITLDLYTGIFFDSLTIACNSLNLNYGTENSRINRGISKRFIFI